MSWWDKGEQHIDGADHLILRESPSETREQKKTRQGEFSDDDDDGDLNSQLSTLDVQSQKPSARCEVEHHSRMSTLSRSPA